MCLGIWLFARVTPCAPYCLRITRLVSEDSKPTSYIVLSSELTRNFASVAF